jgi:hypothetical protein
MTQPEAANQTGPNVFDEPTTLAEQSLNSIEPGKLAAALAYWRLQKGSRPFPAKGDLDPRAMVKYLPQVHIYEALSERLFRAHLVGTGMVDAIGKDMTGAVCSPDSVHPVARRMSVALQRAVDLRGPVFMTAERGVAKRAKQSRVEMLCLPLSDTGEKINYVFCVTTFHLVVEAASQSA